MTVRLVDRAAAVRSALRMLVARNGFHGASMSAVASEAGVATGTAYTHYASKDELVLAAYCEAKAQLAVAAMADLDAGAEEGAQFRSVWLAAYRHLKANPDHAASCCRSTTRPIGAPRTRRRSPPATRWRRRRRRPISPPGHCHLR